ncbi:MAG: phospholipid scramblase-related protein [bacterium]
MLLDYRKFFVKERVAFVKLTDAYDIFDPDTNQPIGLAKDEPPGWAKALRILVNKRFLPTTINIYEQEGEEPLFSLKKKPGFLRVSVVVCDSHGAEFGTLRSKLFSLGGGFTVMDTTGTMVADVKGDWKGWNFRFLDSAGTELGVVTKQWAGLGKEFFTSADNYIISLSETYEALGDHATASLMLAAGLAIDIVFKEQG